MTRHHRSAVLYLAVIVGFWAVATAPASGRARQQHPKQTTPAGRSAQTKPAAATASSQPGNAAGQATFKAGVNFVRVDAIVTRHGKPVNDLKESDFRVYENGKPQKIRTFQLIRIPITPQPEGKEQPPIESNQSEVEQEAANPESRIFVIFLDDYHVRRSNSIKVRQVLTQFVQQDIGPKDLVGIMYPLTPLADITLTENHRSIVDAIQQFTGREYDFKPKNRFEAQYADLPTQEVVAIRNQVSLSALRALMTYLGSLRPSRKAVVLVSEGYTNVLPPQLQNGMAGVPGYGNPNADNPLVSAAGNPTAQAGNFFLNMDMQEDLRIVYSAANRNNTSIYALDPRGLATSEFDISQNVNPVDDQQILDATQNTLRTLSDETDGRAIVNQNDMTKAMEQIVKDSSDYYLLGYNSDLPTDGKFHRIEVRVDQPGLTVRARKGYWALTNEQVAQALKPPKPGPPPAISAALATVSTLPTGSLVRTWIGMSRGTAGKARVRFVWQPAPVPFGDRSLADRRPARVMLTAVEQGGHLEFRGAVPPSPSGKAASPAATAESSNPGAPTSVAVPQGPSQVVFDAPPGTMHLHLSVQGPRGHVIDFNDLAVKVPDFSKTTPALSTPEVFAAETYYQLRKLRSDPGAIPTASHDFSNSTQLLIRFQTYGAAGTTPTVTAHLLNREGASMARLPVTTGQEPGTDEIVLSLGTLPPGAFIVQIKATSGGHDATKLVAFQILG